MSAPSCSRSQMQRLVAVVQELSLARCLAQVQEIVRHAARDLTGADGATFVLRDGDQCFYADENAIQALWKGKRFPMAACISGWVMLNRSPVVIEDIYADPRIPVDAYRPTFVKSLAMVPIRTRQPIGAIGNYWASRHEASECELELLQALADSASIAMENVALLENLTHAKETAEVACRLKDEFLGTISHELRTPLIPIVAWSRMICDDALDASELREAAGEIHENAQAQLRRVEELLDMSRIISGKLQLELVPMRLVAVVESALQSIAPAAAAKGIELERAFDANVGEVLADASRMQQVAWNLLSNAVKFTPRGGRIRVSLAQTATELELRVEDTGIGIAREFTPHLFEHFRQAEGRMNRAASGMGLGLALVRHLVEQHGGTVSALSPGKGRGSTFTVALPLVCALGKAA